MNRPLGRDDDAFPRNAGEITVEWLSRVLREAGAVADGALAGVEVAATTPGFGATGSHARLHLRYARPQGGAPQTLFAKFSSDIPSVRASMHAMKSYEREVGFYRDVAPLMRLCIPRCYYAAIDAETGHSVVLIEDLAAGREGDTLAGCTEADALLMIREAAGFHAQWWNSPLMSGWKWLPGYDGDPTPLAQRYMRAWPLFREKYADLIPPWAPLIAEQALERVPEVFGALARCPATLTHGDIVLDNVRFDLPEAPFVLYDWQLVLRAPAARDVAWFLTRSLPVEQRRQQEDGLVRAYHAALVEAGVRDYPLETLQRHLLLGFLQALYSVISAGVNADFSTERGARVIRARVERNMAVLEDHDVSQVLQG